jgi:hypothetical protein
MSLEQQTDFAAPDEIELSVVDVNTLVKRTLAKLQRHLEKNPISA